MNAETRPTAHGLHHVTAIASDPQQNLDFYTQLMGLRLVKRSVNQDAPDTYHLFYADAVGSPGTDLTFFPWGDMHEARRGAGHVVEVSFAVPSGSLGYWQDRLDEQGVATEPATTRFGETTVTFEDPDGLPLALVETDDEREFTPWEESPVPTEHQLHGMHAVRIWVRSLEPTKRLLTEVMGFVELAEEDGWHRLGADGGGSGTLIDVQERPNERLGRWGTGGVHHVAWRVCDEEEERALRARVQEAGLDPTPPIDRFWFQSVYFKEPGGVLFELATDGPGFERDEDLAHLGERLVLPPALEGRREEIEAALPALDLPDGQS